MLAVSIIPHFFAVVKREYRNNSVSFLHNMNICLTSAGQGSIILTDGEIELGEETTELIGLHNNEFKIHLDITREFRKYRKFSI